MNNWRYANGNKVSLDRDCEQREAKAGNKALGN